MPEPFFSICPHCRAKLKLKDPALIGKLAKCPACQEKFTVQKAAPAAQARPKTAATTSRPAPQATAKSKPKPPPAREPDDELDPWLNDDLSGFDTDDTAVAEGRTAVPAPPPVRGVTRKRKSTSAETTSKKRKKSAVGVEQVSWIGWVVGGAVAGAIGAGAWGAIAAFTFTEWGILAWAIGGFVGFGVRIGAREEDVGLAPGLTALGIAMVAVIAGKFLAVHFMLASIEKLIEGAAGANGAQVQPAETTDDEVLQWILADFADEIQFEWEEQGREWNEPDDETISVDAPMEAWYDPVIWAQAKQKWEALSPEEQAKMIVEYKTGEFDFDGDLGALKAAIFAESFGILDILFFLLAAGTAFKVGSGLDFGDE
jgi:hypothetical protein